MPNISLRQIEIFHAVMTVGNITEAAVLLHSSQPTLSRELARFEQQLGIKLFDRIRGRLRPTVDGIQLFEEVQRSYYGLARIMEAASQIRSHKQASLAIACLPAFSQSLMPRVCARFLQHYPAVNLTIIPQESPMLEEWLSAQRYDIGLTENSQPPAGTEQQILVTLNEVCVLPQGHPLLQYDCLTPKHFAQQRYISLAPNDSYRQALDTLFYQAQVERQMVMETHSAASVCAMVAQGIGISIVNPITALDFSDHGIALRPLSVRIPFSLSLIRPKHRPSSQLLDSFAQHLMDEISHIQNRLPCAFSSPGI